VTGARTERLKQPSVHHRAPDAGGGRLRPPALFPLPDGSGEGIQLSVISGLLGFQTGRKTAGKGGENTRRGGGESSLSHEGDNKSESWSMS